MMQLAELENKAEEPLTCSPKWLSKECAPESDDREADSCRFLHFSVRWQRYA